MSETKNTPPTGSGHEFAVKARRQMSVDGVKDIIGFDETTVQITTTCGDMTVEGSGLHIGVLDVERGVISLEGNIDSVYYSDPNGGEKRSFWSRLVK